MHEDWFIPLPPDATAEARKTGITQRAVGLYPCISKGHCPEFILVKVRKDSVLSGRCSKGEITANGCVKRSVTGALEDIPEQTYEAYLEAVKRVSEQKEIPPLYLAYLENAWNKYNAREMENENIGS